MRWGDWKTLRKSEVKKYLDISAKVDIVGCMLITNPLKKIFLLVGTGLLTVAANASTLTIDNFMQYDRAVAGPGSSTPAYGNGATLPGGIQRQLSVQNRQNDIVDITASGGQLSSFTYNPGTGSSNSEYTYRILRIDYSPSTPLNLLLGGASATDMIMSLHIQTRPSFSCDIAFFSGNDFASWNLYPGSNSSGLFSSSLGSIDSTFNWGSVDSISMNISTIPGGAITLGKDNLGLRVAAVPEPSALSLLAVGLGGLAIFRRRRS